MYLMPCNIYVVTFYSTIFGVRGKSQQDSATTANKMSNSVTEHQIEQKHQVAISQSPLSALVLKKSDMEKSTTALILQERPK